MRIAGCASFLLGILAVTGAAAIASAAERRPSAEIIVGPHTDQATLAIKSDPDAHRLLPDRVKSSGRIVAGLESNAGYPNSVTVNAKNYGLTIDLGQALAAALGIEITEVTMPFSNIIPSLGSGRIDLTPSLILDRPDRRQVVDFVDASYGLAFTFILNEGSSLESITYETACGQTIGANAGSSQATRLSDRSKECEAERKKPIDIRRFPSNAETMLAVQSGRVESALLSAAMVKYMLRGNPKGIRAGSDAQAEKTGLVGIGFAKGSDLVPAFRQAMLALHRSGAWKEILAQYNYAEAFPPESVILNTAPVTPGKLPAHLLP